MRDRYGDDLDVDTWPQVPPPGRVLDDQARALAIVDCELCDDSGIRGILRCDHRDHYRETEHGRRLLADEMQKIRERKKTPTIDARSD